MMDESLAAFLAESHEALVRLETDLVEAEGNPADMSRLASIFRAIHTIKGTCGFFGFPHLERLTHAAEDTLSLLRDGKISLSFPLVNALMALADAVREMLGQIEDTGRDGDNDYAALATVFRRLAGEVGSDAATGQAIAAAPAEPVGSEEADRIALPAENTVRVGVALLDKLMNAAGELVLARNRILQHAATLGDGELVRASNRLNVVASELQEGLMKTRMQAVSALWSGYPRLVRDLEVQTGKRVRLEREGEGTEVDRTLLQAIRDPLTHLIRNAVDHGIEAPAARIAAGKPEQGTVRVRAFHENGHVVIEVADDGAGIDAAAVLGRAVARGLLSADQAARAGEREIAALLFQPGFSTAPAVTSISGRGVGLDVVRNNIEQVGGTVEIQSVPGAGTTFQVKVPLTLAIIPTLVVGCQNERFAVPQVNLLEIVHVAAGDDAGDDGLEILHGVPIYRLRGKLLPLVDLRTFLGFSARMPRDDSCYVLVLEVDRRQYGLIVDAVHDAEEIVVKPLGRQLKAVNCFAGATVMGDGRVALILDVKSIARMSRVLEAGGRAGPGDDARTVAGTRIDEHHAMVLFRIGAAGRGALPLAAVSRLEKFPAASIEFSAGREVVQYRGRILPLVRVRECLGISAAGMGPAEETLQVIVHHGERGSVGMVVDEIVDIVEQELDFIQRKDAVRGILGSVVIQGCVTDIIDLDQVLAPLLGELLRAPEKFSTRRQARG